MPIINSRKRKATTTPAGRVLHPRGHNIADPLGSHVDDETASEDATPDSANTTEPSIAQVASGSIPTANLHDLPFDILQQDKTLSEALNITPTRLTELGLDPYAYKYSPAESSAAVKLHSARGDHLLSFAATSKQIRAAANSFAAHYLAHKDTPRDHRPVVDFSSDRIVFREGVVVHRPGLPFISDITRLMEFVKNFCVFCGVRAFHRATVMNGLACCFSCERREYKLAMDCEILHCKIYRTNARDLIREYRVVTGGRFPRFAVAVRGRNITPRLVLDLNDPDVRRLERSFYAQTRKGKQEAKALQVAVQNSQ